MQAVGGRALAGSQDKTRKIRVARGGDVGRGRGCRGRSCGYHSEYRWADLIYLL